MSILLATELNCIELPAFLVNTNQLTMSAFHVPSTPILWEVLSLLVPIVLLTPLPLLEVLPARSTAHSDTMYLTMRVLLAQSTPSLSAKVLTYVHPALLVPLLLLEAPLALVQSLAQLESMSSTMYVLLVQ